MNNTIKHISDDATYVSFDPKNTRFPSSIINVQAALSYPNDVASEVKSGYIKIASKQDIIDASDDTKAVTPLKLEMRMQRPEATEKVRGVAMLATKENALAGTDDTKIITPLKLKHVTEHYFTTRTSKENALGVIKLSTEAGAKAGVDDTTAMTPKKTRMAIAAAVDAIPDVEGATEAIQGIVTLATVGQAEQGTLRNGYAISPYTLNLLTGSATRRGIVRSASRNESWTGVDDSIYISAKGFKEFKATRFNAGTVTLTDTVGFSSGGDGIALSSTANVISSNGGNISGSLNVNGSLTQNNSPVANITYVNNAMPIGSVIMWVGDGFPNGGLWRVCDGGVESKSSRSALFNAIGYKFGGSGDQFNRPDMRGLFVRGAGISSHISNQTGSNSNGSPKLGNGCGGGYVGSVQTQQVRSHKHAVSWGDEYRDQWTYGASIGRNYMGMGRNSKSYTDWDNYRSFSNDGSEIEYSGTTGNSVLNSDNLIGMENRPWNMSVNYIIRVA